MKSNKTRYMADRQRHNAHRSIRKHLKFTTRKMERAESRNLTRDYELIANADLA